MNPIQSFPIHDYLREEEKCKDVKGDCTTQKRMVTDDPRSLTIWLDSKEAAKFLRVSVQMLWNHTSNGVIPYYKFGRSNRYRLKDLENLLLKNKRGIP